MQASAIDERVMVRENLGASFLVFFYEGDDQPDVSWSVHSYLLTDTELPDALIWVRDNIPTSACWSLGVVTSPAAPTIETELEVDWIIGADVLNMDSAHRRDREQRLAEEMLVRRASVDLLTHR